MDRIHVLLAGHYKLLRAGIRMLLENLRDIEVVAEASNGREAISLVEQNKPQVVLVDVAISVVDALEVTRRLASAFPLVRVVILAMDSDEAYAHQALQAGAAGYLSMAADSGDLAQAIRTVAQGKTYFGPSISKNIIAGSEPLKVLSPRQLQVLKLIVEGKTTKQIAMELNISEKTVETHRMNLMNRLDIHDIAGLVHFAVKVGMLNLQN
jgi:DNA-binding NarL/FixJ family response regulator